MWEQYLWERELEERELEGRELEERELEERELGERELEEKEQVKGLTKRLDGKRDCAVASSGFPRPVLAVAIMDCWVRVDILDEQVYAWSRIS